VDIEVFPKCWRVLDTEAHDAPWNMALDEALLLSCDEQPHITLRFYGWARPTLSLGYFQSVHDVNLDECARRGFEWIRRPTGGRAVLHDHELTYSIVAPIEALGASVAQSHERISRALAVGLEKLGLHAEFSPSRASAKEASAACFAAPAFVELTVQGKKIIGSAQVRTKRSLLQHGSIPITIDFEAWEALMKISASALRRKAISVSEALGQELSIDELKRALIEGFQEYFGVECVPGELTPAEHALAQKLSVEKYATPQWNRLR
jgi:lipoate-protein ligase A